VGEIGKLDHIHPALAGFTSRDKRLRAASRPSYLLKQTLADPQSLQGGWPFALDCGQPALEPTCLALLSLRVDWPLRVTVYNRSLMLSRSFLAAVALLSATVPAQAQAERALMARSCFICDAGVGVRAIARDTAGRYYVLTTPGPAVLIYGADGKRTGQLPAKPTKENSIVFGADLVLDSSGPLVGTAKTNRKGHQARHCDLGLI